MLGFFSSVEGDYFSPPPFFLRFYLFIDRERERETASERGNTSRGSVRGRSRLIAEEPDMGLDPITRIP